MTTPLVFIGLPEVGYIVGIAVILFGCKESLHQQEAETAMDADDCRPQLGRVAVVLLHLLYKE